MFVYEFFSSINKKKYDQYYVSLNYILGSRNIIVGNEGGNIWIRADWTP